MGAPIRSAEAIQVIINNGQHAIADLGLDIVREEKRGIDNTDPEHRQKIYRLILLRTYLQNMLDENGDIIAFYQDPLNEKKENNLLTGIAKLSGLYGGPAIPKITGNQIPLVYYPSSNTYINQSSEAVPGGITFENTNIDAPGEVVDTIDASVSTYAFYIMTVIGTGIGEGSRGSVLLVTWRGTNTPVVTEYAGGDVGGSTAGVSFSAALVGGNIELTCNVPTDDWIVRGSRISFYNISFQNQPIISQLPTGGLVGQLLRKKSLTDFDLEYFTLIWSNISDITASLAEINRVTGVTSPIQDQIDALNAALGDYVLTTALTTILSDYVLSTDLATDLANYLLKSGGTMSGNIAMGSNKITGLAAASAAGEAVRYEQLTSSSLIVTNRQTSNYTLVLTDANKLIEMNVTGSSNEVIIPLNATVAFPIGTQILISQYGTGQTQVSVIGGVTLNSEGGKTFLIGQYAGATLVKIATDEWYLFGAITT